MGVVQRMPYYEYREQREFLSLHDAYVEITPLDSNTPVIRLTLEEAQQRMLVSEVTDIFIIPVESTGEPYTIDSEISQSYGIVADAGPLDLSISE